MTFRIVYAIVKPQKFDSTLDIMNIYLYMKINYYT